MQNTQNNFTVETLIAKYRNHVNEHCTKAIDTLIGNGELHDVEPPFEIDGNPDEQLLITLYKKVTGENADVRIVEALSEFAEKFYEGVLTNDEISYLCNHFSEVVSYEFANRNEWYLRGSNHYKLDERIRLVKEYVKPQKGAKVFIADSGYCDLAVLFPECIIYGFTGMTHQSISHQHQDTEIWALGQIRLFAAGIKSEIVSGEGLFEEYSYPLPEKESMDIVILGVSEDEIIGTECKDKDALYDILKPNGKMLFFSTMIEMSGKETDIHGNFRTLVTNKKAVSTIVSFEEEGYDGLGRDKKIMLEICKCENKVVRIKDEVSSKTKSIDSRELDSEMLWPSYYLTDSPTDGVKLSSLVRVGNTRIKDEKDFVEFVKGKGWTLHDKAYCLPLVTSIMLEDSYKDADLVPSAELAEVQSDAHKSKDVKRNSSTVENIMAEMLWGGLTKNPCVFLTGSSDEIKIGYTTIVPKIGIGYSGCCCLIPQDDIDVRYIAALLFEPTVKNQILSICDGMITGRTLSLAIDKIIVPRHNDKERLIFLSEANYQALQMSRIERKREHENYTKAVRMRKHALTQSLSSIGAKFNTLNKYRIRQNGKMSDEDVLNPQGGTSVKEVFEYLSVKIKDMMPVLDHIADVEYSFSKPEYIDPEEFFENYIKKEEKGWLNFKPVISWEKGGNKAKQDIKNINGIVVCEKGKPLNTLMFPKDALEKIIDNILSNAKAYAFTDDTRTDYQLRFSWHTDGASLIVEIDNNGTPIPEDRDTDSLLEYGVSTALHKDGHNGIGCNEIKDIMNRYDGNVEIVSSPKDDFTVKYLLTFHNANTNVFRLNTI